MKEVFYYFDLLYFYVYVSLFNHFIQFSFFLLYYSCPSAGGAQGKAWSKVIFSPL